MADIQSPRTFQALLNRDGTTCPGCRKPMDVENRTMPNGATIDHIQPQAKGGGDGLANLRLMCRTCNLQRGSTWYPEKQTAHAGQVGALSRTVVGNLDVCMDQARQRYSQRHPDWFLTDILGCPRYIPESGKPGMYDKQIEAILSVRDNRRTAVVGANGSGKDYGSGRTVLWWMYAWDDAMAIVYGPTYRQISEIIWKEARVAFHAALVKLPGYMYPQAAKYRISDKREAAGFSATGQESGAGIQGFHAGHLLVIVTEAHAVSQSEIDSLLRLNPDRMLLTGNPLSTGGEFYDAFHSKSDIYNTITISAFDTPNIQEGHTLIPGMVTVEAIDERAREFGEESPMYRQSILGEFPKDDMAALITIAQTEEAVERDLSPGEDDDPGSAILGVDVARYGDDSSVIAYRRGPVIRFPWKGKGKSLMDTVAAVVEVLDNHPEVDLVAIDDTGMGGGVTDRLLELNLTASIVPFIAGAKADESERFFNATMEAWWTMRDAFREGQADIPNDAPFISQVTTRKYKTQSDKTIKLESKDEMKGRLRKSPDEADALSMTYSPLVGPPRIRWFG